MNDLTNFQSLIIELSVGIVVAILISLYFHKKQQTISNKQITISNKQDDIIKEIGEITKKQNELYNDHAFYSQWYLRMEFRKLLEMTEKLKLDNNEKREKLIKERKKVAEELKYTVALYSNVLVSNGLARMQSVISSVLDDSKAFHDQINLLNIILEHDVDYNKFKF